MRMKPVVVFAIVALALSSVGLGAKGKQVSEIGPWPTLASTLSARGASGRPILLEFHQEGCTFCRRLRTEVYTKPDIRKALAPLTKARVETTTQDGGALADRFRVDFMPTLLLIDVTGRTLRRLDGLPSPSALRDLLGHAQTARPGHPDEFSEWMSAGDLALQAGAPGFAASCFRHALRASQPAQAAAVRLWLGRSLEKAGELREAAATLEPFASTPEPAHELRPALETLVRIRRAMGDRRGEARAREAFRAAFPNLPAPE